MANEQQNSRVMSIVHEIGRQGLNAMFPKEFEYYAMALELADSRGQSLDYFMFPVMPESFDEQQPSLERVRKTASGVSVLSTNSFVPRNITINGNFGRSFKFLVGRDLFDFKAVSFSFKPIVNFAVDNLPIPVYHNQIKTGYGCYKVLESMIDSARTRDQYGMPKQLFFYNMALGNSYVVRPIVLMPKQSMDKNMIWQYMLQMTAVAPISAVRNQTESRAKALVVDTVQKAATNLLNVAKSNIL